VEVLAAGGLTLRVIDLSGREVRTLMNGPALPGSIEAVWDGRDNQGRHASPGQYLIVAAQTVGVQSRKILLLP
jgi:flagellar hook assembly protein FlgD